MNDENEIVYVCKACDIFSKKHCIISEFNENKNINENKIYDGEDKYNYYFIDKFNEISVEYLENLLYLKEEIIDEMKLFLQTLINNENNLDLLSENKNLMDIQTNDEYYDYYLKQVLEAVNNEIENAIVNNKTIIIQIIASFVPLTDREKEIIELYFEEEKPSQMAKKLNITKKTVASHIKNIVIKITDNADLMNFIASEKPELVDIINSKNPELNSTFLKTIMDIKFDYSNPNHWQLYQKGKEIFFDRAEKEVEKWKLKQKAKNKK